MSLENVSVHFKNLVKMTNKETGKILVNKLNAIHPQNMARVIARGLAGEEGHNIYKVALGNGGTYVDSGGIIRFNNPNTTGIEATLFNQTYEEVVYNQGGNSTYSTASLTDLTSIVHILMTLTSDEPADQWLTDANGSDTLTNPEDPDAGYAYQFDELGCFAMNPEYDAQNPSAAPEWLLLTHIIFQPIDKTENRQIELSYDLTVSCS
jgi:hypothetical protein